MIVIPNELWPTEYSQTKNKQYTEFLNDANTPLPLAHSLLLSWKKYLAPGPSLGILGSSPVAFLIYILANMFTHKGFLSLFSLLCQDSLAYPPIYHNLWSCLSFSDPSLQWVRLVLSVWSTMLNPESWESAHINKLKLSCTQPYNPCSKFTLMFSLHILPYILAKFCCSFCCIAASSHKPIWAMLRCDSSYWWRGNETR